MSPSEFVRRITTAILGSLLLSPVAVHAQKASSFDSSTSKTASALDNQVSSDMYFLAADELHGSGSATRDEHIAALFAAAQFQALGLEPGGDNGTFLQKSALPV